MRKIEASTLKTKLTDNEIMKKQETCTPFAPAIICTESIGADTFAHDPLTTDLPRCDSVVEAETVPVLPISSAINGIRVPQKRRGRPKGRLQNVLPPPPIHSEEDFQEMRRHLDGVLQNIISKVTQSYAGRKRSRSSRPSENMESINNAPTSEEQSVTKQGIDRESGELLQESANEHLPSPVTDGPVEDVHEAEADVNGVRKRRWSSRLKVLDPQMVPNIIADAPEEFAVPNKVRLECKGANVESSTSVSPLKAYQLVTDAQTESTFTVDANPLDNSTSSIAHSQKQKKASQVSNINKLFPPSRNKLTLQSDNRYEQKSHAVVPTLLNATEETSDSMVTPVPRSAAPASPDVEYYHPLAGASESLPPKLIEEADISEIVDSRLISTACGESSEAPLLSSELTENNISPIIPDMPKLLKKKIVPPWRRHDKVNHTTVKNSSLREVLGQKVPAGPVYRAPSIVTSTPKKNPNAEIVRPPSATIVAPICDQCGRGFSSFCDLNSHWRLHVYSSRRFFCSLCKQRFMLADSLAKHARRHHGVVSLLTSADSAGRKDTPSRQRPFAYLCSDCGCLFKWMADLAVHLQLKHGAPSSDAVARVAPALLVGSRRCGMAPFIAPRRSVETGNDRDVGSSRPQFICGDCNKKMEGVAELDVHRRLFHENASANRALSDDSEGTNGLIEVLDICDEGAPVRLSEPRSGNKSSSKRYVPNLGLKEKSQTAETRKEETASFKNMSSRNSLSDWDMQSKPHNNGQFNTVHRDKSYSSLCKDPLLRSKSVSPVSSKSNSPSLLSASSCSILSKSQEKTDSNCSKNCSIVNFHANTRLNEFTSEVVIDKIIPSLNCPMHSKLSDVKSRSEGNVCPVHKVLSKRSSSLKSTITSQHKQCKNHSGQHKSSKKKRLQGSNVISHLSKIPPCHRKPLVCILPLSINSLHYSESMLSKTNSGRKSSGKSACSPRKNQTSNSKKSSLNSKSLRSSKETIPSSHNASSASKEVTSSKNISMSSSLPNDILNPAVVLKRINLSGLHIVE